MVLIFKHIQRWKIAKGSLNAVQNSPSQLTLTFRHLRLRQGPNVAVSMRTEFLTALAGKYC